MGNIEKLLDFLLGESFLIELRCKDSRLKLRSLQPPHALEPITVFGFVQTITRLEQSPWRMINVTFFVILAKVDSVQAQVRKAEEDARLVDGILGDILIIVA